MSKSGRQAFVRNALRVDTRWCARATASPLIVADQRTRTCCNSKCYSVLCASEKTRGAVEHCEKS
ncbi:hypothetical protein EHS39_29660 [Ensifer sp. MPMI2T]|nr:hypothetical protein EHS39_29660 [Ensifer sp. MPMI2T]